MAKGGDRFLVSAYYVVLRSARYFLLNVELARGRLARMDL